MVGYMDSSTSHQEMGLQTLESMLTCNKTQQEKKPRPADMQALKCPRCDSANTKFCYYNNYSLSQPRYFCKSCRRYWTKGGTLRNVPVGGGCRKNKRSSSSSSSSSRRSQDQQLTPITSPIPSMGYDSNDLTLAIARLQKQNSGNGFEDYDYSSWGHHHHGDVIGSFGGNQNQNPSSSGLFDAIRSGFLENSGGGNGFQNLYYGMGNGNVEMGMNGSQDMGMGYEEFGGVATSTTASTAVTTVKQEVRGGGDGVDGRVLWGLPWQSLGGDGNGPDLDSGRLNWNGIGPLSNWHGVLNSPLM